MTSNNKNLKFRHYIYIFLAVAVFTFTAFGWILSKKIGNINQQFTQSAANEAAMEVKHAMENVLLQIDKLAQETISWDEVHQQLANPDYYGYWKAQRASSRKLPSYIENIDLYDTSHTILGKTRDAASPTNINNIDNHYIIDKNALYYIAIFPIPSRAKQGEIDGYLLLKSNVIPAIIETNQLTVTDISSLRVISNDSALINPPDVMQHLKFMSARNPLFDELFRTTRSTLIYGFIIILFFTFFLYYIAQSLISVPLSKLTNYVEQLKIGVPAKKGELRFKIYEFDKLRESIDIYQQELTRINSNLDRKNDELWNLAHHDSLTGAANRRAYEEDWKSYISIADNKRFDFSYMLIDCDHFKAINDTYGHDVGDKLIVTLVHLLQNSLRDGDKLYRIGGDEFVTILWNSDANIADKVAQRCLDNIRKHSFTSLGINEPVTISIGLATQTIDTPGSMQALPRQADIAMYHAKKSGSRSIIHYDETMETHLAPLVSNRIIDAVIRAASTYEGIVLHYQPVVNVKTGKTDYFEALLRIRDKQGLISAGDIFPVAEKLSLEAEIDLAVLKCVENDLKHRLIPCNTGVSINFSAALFSLPELNHKLQHLAEYLADYDIIFEVTENTLISDLKMVSLKLDQLRQQGFQIALDDFGSGYSSIRYLANMPIDIVKFDISMIKQLAMEDKSRAIISGTAGVILRSGFKLVAEGIENSDLINVVTNMGATHMQGYALGKPAPLDVIMQQATG
ncbi:MAG: GGDEF domain-containing protein [Gammaproteobacteria bacterium]|nr:GGDEF domain-containing protein [Gammaproteobacteria bacterium]